MVVRGGRATAEHAGDADAVFPYASVTKVAASLAVLVEVSAGGARSTTEVGPPGATLAHLLSHASGLPLDGQRADRASRSRRVYSNTGIDLAVAHAAVATRATPVELLEDHVFGPLGMTSTEARRRPVVGGGRVDRELCALAAELLGADVLVPSWLAARQRAVAFPGLVGVLPGFGRQEPCDWGLGVEVRGTKRPHWTGPAWPPTAFGHFGQVGGFLVVDVDAGRGGRHAR